jgi:hypothetical protein
LALVAALASSTGALWADDVLLRNGSSFEDVVALRTATHVVVELPAGGRLRLPNEQVLEVVERTSALQRFREYRDELLAHPGSSGSDVLDLVRWAQLNGLDREARSLALVLARAQPDLEGLTPLLAAIGYARDDQGAWVLHDELRRAQGLVPHDGEWITPEALAEEWRQARAEQVRSEAEQRSMSDGPSAGDPSDNAVALESLRLAQAVVEQQGSQRPETRQIPVTAAVVGGFAPVRGSSGAAGYEAYRAQIRADISALSRRQPGSILPLSVFRDSGVP